MRWYTLCNGTINRAELMPLCGKNDCQNDRTCCSSEQACRDGLVHLLKNRFFLLFLLIGLAFLAFHLAFPAREYAPAYNELRERG